MPISDVTLTLPPHAVRTLVEMCRHERERLAKLDYGLGYDLQLDAALDALRCIEEALPLEAFADRADA